MTLRAQGEQLTLGDWAEDTLYRDEDEAQFVPKQLTFIPYYAWVNREPGEMTVWMHEKI